MKERVNILQGKASLYIDESIEKRRKIMKICPKKIQIENIIFYGFYYY